MKPVRKYFEERKEQQKTRPRRRPELTGTIVDREGRFIARIALWPAEQRSERSPTYIGRATTADSAQYRIVLWRREEGEG